MTNTTITLRLSPEQQTSLSSLAANLGYFHGTKPSINAMVKAIADQKDLAVVKAEYLDPIVNRQVLARELNLLQAKANRIQKLLLVDDNQISDQS